MLLLRARVGHPRHLQRSGHVCSVGVLPGPTTCAHVRRAVSAVVVVLWSCGVLEWCRIMNAVSGCRDFVVNVMEFVLMQKSQPNDHWLRSLSAKMISVEMCETPVQIKQCLISLESSYFAQELLHRPESWTIILLSALTKAPNPKNLSSKLCKCRMRILLEMTRREWQQQFQRGKRNVFLVQTEGFRPIRSTEAIIAALRETMMAGERAGYTVGYYEAGQNLKYSILTGLQNGMDGNAGASERGAAVCIQRPHAGLGCDGKLD